MTSDKEGRDPYTRNRSKGTRTLGRNRWPTHETSGKRSIALGRKKAASGVMRPHGQQKARRGEPTGLAMDLGLSTVARKGGQNEKQGEQQAKGEIT